MKKFYTFLLTVVISAVSYAQLQTQLLSPGIYKITYGASNDYSLYDPGYQVQKFYIHTFINPSDNSTGNLYQDDWFNSNVTMTFDSSVGAYVGTIDLNNKIFTSGNVKLPASTYVSKVGMVFKDLQSGANKQSGDLSIRIPTTTLSPLATIDLGKNLKKSFVASGKLFTNQTGNLEVVVYDMLGRIISRSKTKSSDSGLVLNVNQNGTYIVKVSNGQQAETVKFIK